MRSCHPHGFLTNSQKSNLSYCVGLSLHKFCSCQNSHSYCTRKLVAGLSKPRFYAQGKNKHFNEIPIESVIKLHSTFSLSPGKLGANFTVQCGYFINYTPGNTYIPAMLKYLVEYLMKLHSNIVGQTNNLT